MKKRTILIFWGWLSTLNADEAFNGNVTLETFENIFRDTIKSRQMFDRYTKMKNLNVRKHTLWLSDNYTTFKDKAVSLNTKGCYKSYSLGYMHKINNKINLESLFTVFRGRSFSTNFFTQTQSGAIQSINAWSRSHAQSITPFVLIR